MSLPYVAATGYRPDIGVKFLDREFLGSSRDVQVCKLKELDNGSKSPQSRLIYRTLNDIDIHIYFHTILW